METITIITIIISILHLICLIVKQVIWHVAGKWHSSLPVPEAVIDACASILLFLLCIASCVIEGCYLFKGLDIAPIRIMCIYMTAIGVLFIAMNAAEGDDHYELPGAFLLALNAVFAIVALIG